MLRKTYSCDSNTEGRGLKKERILQIVGILAAFKEEDDGKDMGLSEVWPATKGFGVGSGPYFRERENMLLIQRYKNKH